MQRWSGEKENTTMIGLKSGFELSERTGELVMKRSEGRRTVWE